MLDEPAFLRTIRDRSDDVDPRLVYADWREEEGRCDEAEFDRRVADARRNNIILPFLDQVPAAVAHQFPLLLEPLRSLKQPATSHQIGYVRSVLTALLRETPLGDLLTPEGQEQQYYGQLLLLQSLGHLICENGRTGIDGIGGFHPLPTLDAIHAHLATIEGIEPNDQLLLEPFALPLATQFQRAEEWMLRHRCGLFQSELHEARQIIHSDRYNNADVSGNLVYNPVCFTRSHGGQTKRQIVEEQQKRNDPLEGWRIRVIPASSRQIKPPHREVYAQDAITPGHKVYIPPHQRLTPESYLQLWLSHFIATGQMLDSSDADHTWTCLPGAYFPPSADSSSGYVPYAHFSQLYHQLTFVGDVPGNPNPRAGVRRSR